MKTNDIEDWWKHLTVVEKERIASKILTKDSGVPTTISYPTCTKVWEEQSDERKESIRRHCTDNHGLLLPEYKEGKTMSY